MQIALILLATAVVVFLILAAMRPADFRYARSMAIKAPAPAIFPHVNDFHLWSAWSPWEKLDPDMRRSYGGPDSGVGAFYAWSGNNKVGEGRTTIIQSHPSELIRMELLFLRPFACTNQGAFYFHPEGDQTVVTWEMTGKNNFMAKAAGMIMNLDKMCGGMFEQGLSQLKTVVEKSAPV